jgi:hypothetical protein
LHSIIHLDVPIETIPIEHTTYPGIETIYSSIHLFHFVTTHAFPEVVLPFFLSEDPEVAISFPSLATDNVGFDSET